MMTHTEVPTLRRVGTAYIRYRQGQEPERGGDRYVVNEFATEQCRFLKALDAAKLGYDIASEDDEATMITVAGPNNGIWFADFNASDGRLVTLTCEVDKTGEKVLEATNFADALMLVILGMAALRDETA